jgi:hypothetical protein
MIINEERNPSISLYYLGSFVLKSLRKENNQTLEQLYSSLKNDIDYNLHIDFFYYSLDWLFIISAIKLENGRVCLCELTD